MRHVFPFLLAVVLTWAVPVPTWAQAGATTAQARTWYEKGRFKEALKVLETREKDPSVADDERVEIYVLRASSYAALGKAAERDATLDLLVTLRPLYELDPVASHPEMRAALEARRKQWGTTTGFVVEGVAIAPPKVRVTLIGNLARAKDVELFYRPHGEVTLLRARMPVENGLATFTLPDVSLWDRAAAASGLDVVAEVKDVNGVGLARLGDAVHPRQVPVTADQAAQVHAETAPPAPVVAPVPTNTAPPATSAAPSTDDDDEVPVRKRKHRGEGRQSRVLSPPRAAGMLLGTVVTPLAMSCLGMAGCLGGCLLNSITRNVLTEFGLAVVSNVLWAITLAMCPLSLAMLALGGTGAAATGIMWWAGWLSVPEKDIETPD